MCRALMEKLDSLEEQEAAKEGRSVVPGAVLIFLPGIHEIKHVRDFLMAQVLHLHLYSKEDLTFTKIKTSLWKPRPRPCRTNKLL